ncbi:hypothetical protein D7X33_18970 [Butyricicoccus sp. 1XD8-22]|nr:hypothetical protein D7X33_18970 [Butyricicoccus sp. 1XD8-22]
MKNVSNILKLKNSFSVKAALVFSIALISLFLFYDTPEASASVQDAITKAGLTTGGGEEESLLGEGKALIYFLMAAGGLIIVGCLIVAAVKFAGSSGNSQKRSEAIMWIVGCFIGVWIVYKAFDLAGWAVNIGS